MLKSIHFLRFVASLGVAIQHAVSAFIIPGATFQLGYAGVDIFFVISGFVIGYSTPDTETPLTFLLKRFIRVLPLYWIATLVYVGVGYFLHLHYFPHYAPSYIFRSMLLLPTMTIYPPGWTILHEVRFYVFFGLLLFIKSARNPALLCAVLAAGISLVRIPIPWQPGMYFDTIWGLYFAGGLLIAEACKRGFRLDRPIGAICVITSLIVFFHHGHFPGVADRFLFWGIPSILLVAGILSLEGASFFDNRIFKIGGDTSYSLYLIHMTVIKGVYVSATIFNREVKYSISSFVIMLALSILIAIAFHLWIEKPLLFHLRKKFLPEKAGN